MRPDEKETMLALIRSRLVMGYPMHMQYLENRRVWWMEAGSERIDIPDHFAMMLLTSGEVQDELDSFFGLPGNSQTYRGKQ